MKGLLTLALLLSALASEARSIRGYYEVPVDDPALQAFNRFSIEFPEESYDAESMTFEFSLPPELTGHSDPLRLQKVGDAWNLTGGRTECLQGRRTITCDMRFENLRIDTDAAIRRIEQIARSPFEREALISIARRFGTEPIGILHYEVRYRKDRDATSSEY